jgi:putative transposase
MNWAYDRDALLEYCQRLRLPGTGVRLLLSIAAGQPVRSVGGGPANSPTRYASTKMGCAIDVEAKSTELRGLVTFYEFEADVEAYFDQPWRIPVPRRFRSGHREMSTHVPDFLVIRPDRAGFEEWKVDRDLIEKAKEQFEMYTRDEAGEWHCPPAEEWAWKHGLYYKIRTLSEIEPIYYQNLRLLERYLRQPSRAVDPTFQKAFLDELRRRGHFTLGEATEWQA